MNQSTGLAPSVIAKALEGGASSTSELDPEPSRIDQLEHRFRNCLYAMRMEVMLLKRAGYDEHQLADVYELLEKDQVQAEELLTELVAILREPVHES